MGVNSLHIAAHGFRTGRHGAVDPCPDGNRRSPAQVTTETGGNLDGQADLAGAHALVQLGVVCDGWAFAEVARTFEIKDIIAADSGLVPVEHRKGEVLNIQADAVAHDEHQDHAPHQGKGQADRITAQFQALSTGVAEQASQAEETAPLSGDRGLFPEGRGSGGRLRC